MGDCSVLSNSERLQLATIDDHVLTKMLITLAFVDVACVPDAQFLAAAGLAGCLPRQVTTWLQTIRVSL